MSVKPRLQLVTARGPLALAKQKPPPKRARLPREWFTLGPDLDPALQGALTTIMKRLTRKG